MLNQILQQLPDVKVAVVVPVYRGLAETRRCIESVLASVCKTESQTIIINDCSPEPEIAEYLTSLQGIDNLQVVQNERNLGFVATVNRGMDMLKDHDIILLNSDTEVEGDWIDRLVVHAYSAQNIASVTPFSNNATICSYPSMEGSPTLPEGVTLSQIDNVCRSVNLGRSVGGLPTGVGSCMYLRRDSLSRIGLFDQEAFGKGYGEENDWCMRGINCGLVHLHALDTFVYHRGEVSFSRDATFLRKSAVELIMSSYPNYGGLVAKYVAEDPAFPFRTAITAGLYRSSGKPVVLMITHNWGGGTEKHVGDLAKYFAGQVKFLILRPDNNGKVTIGTMDSMNMLNLSLDPVVDYSLMIELLKSFGICQVHIHHIVGFTINIRQIVRDIGVPFIFTVHDYYGICPSINLKDKGNKYCGEPDTSSCLDCPAKRPDLGPYDITWWRKNLEWLFEDAQAVICPSVDAAKRIRGYHKRARLVVTPHDALFPIATRAVEPLKLLSYEPLRIGILGVLSEFKGARKVAEVAKAAKARDLKLEFYIIGKSEIEMPFAPKADIYETGPYEVDQVQGLICTVNPHLMWFPAQWPETHSYTLSQAFEAGLPVVTTNLGAFTERLADRPWSWIHDWDLPAGELVDFFVRIREENFLSCLPPTVMQEKAETNESILQQQDFYVNHYLKRSDHVLSETKRTHWDSNDRMRILTLVTRHELPSDWGLPYIPDACGYIRVVGPILHPSLTDFLDVEFVTPEIFFDQPGDVLLINRHAVDHPQTVKEIIRKCRGEGIKIVYDIDDGLLDIPSYHPEYDRYRSVFKCVAELAKTADHVLVSTEYLARRMKTMNRNIHVVPNALDESVLVNTDVSFDQRSGPLRILYMGTATHGSDLDLIIEPIRRICKEFGPEHVIFEIIGVQDRTSDSDFIQRFVVPSKIAMNYLLFMNYLMKHQHRWDIGVAPLVDSVFNRCKSHIKYLDYAALGIAGVFSDLDPYNSVIQHGRNGLLVQNTPTAWYEAIKTLVTDPTLRTGLAKNSYRDLRDNHTLAAQTDFRRNLWREIISSR